MATSSKSSGVPPDYILSAISHIESNETSYAKKLNLMTRLIPKQSIPEEAFIRMTCLLCNSEFRQDLKIEIVKWMNSVYSFVDDLSNFGDFIEILLQLLKNDTLQPYICQLLFRITRKEHATTDRVNYIADLILQFESKPCLIHLMFLYINFCYKDNIEPKEDSKIEFVECGVYPSLIKNVHPSYDATIPVDYIFNEENGQPVPPFSVRIKKCTQQPSFQKTPEEVPGAQIDKILDKSRKSPETESDEGDDFLTIYQEFESLEKKSIRTILKNKYRRLFLSCGASQEKKASIEDFILVSMHSNLQNLDFLDDIQEVFHEVQEPVPDISDLTQKIIEQWDGSSGLNVILRMLCLEPLCCFEKFQYKLEIVVTNVLNSSYDAKCDLIDGLSNLYQQWVLREYEQTSLTSCLKCTCTVSDDSSTSSDGPSIVKEIDRLGNYINAVADAFLFDDDFHICILNEILCHNEKVSRCHIDSKKGLVLHPLSTTVFHAALFSRDSVALESLCSLMIKYISEVKNMGKNNHPEYSFAKVYWKRFSNDFHMVLVNGRYDADRITHLTKENVVSKMIEAHPNFEKYFQIHRHPALIQDTASLIENWEMEVPLTQIKNSPEALDTVFEHLEVNGKEDLVRLLRFVVGMKKKAASKQ